MRTVRMIADKTRSNKTVMHITRERYHFNGSTAANTGRFVGTASGVETIGNAARGLVQRLLTRRDVLRIDCAES